MSKKPEVTAALRVYIVEAYEDGLSTREISKRLAELGISASHSYVNRLLKQEGVHLREPARGDGTGRSIHNEGHVRIYVGRGKHHRATKAGYVWEHVLVVEESLGRPLSPSESIHHINGIPSDNRSENLLVCRSEKEHRWIHAVIKATERECLAILKERFGVLSDIDEALFSCRRRARFWPIIHEERVLPALPFVRRIADGEDPETVKAQYIAHVKEQTVELQEVGDIA